jgi:hypothetical protein
MSESTSTHEALDVRVRARQPHEPTGRHRSQGRAGAVAPALHARTRHTGPQPASRLIMVGFAIALLFGWPFLTDSPVARSLAWAGLAVGGVFVGVGTVAAGVRLGLRWVDYHH